MIRRALLVASVVGVACAPPPRPGVLEAVERTRSTAAARETAALAPQAYLEADKTYRDAERAFDSGDRAGAQILGEQALAAYARAQVLARLARADSRLANASDRRTLAQKELEGVEAEQQHAAAEADDLEMRARVVRDALPLTPTEPASPDRERARLAAARAIALQARLLCVATQMLSSDTPGVIDAFKSLDALDAALDAKPARTPIDEAVRLRSTCLAELTKVRRPGTIASVEAGKPDALLEDLGKAGLEPARDDRGVIVVLRSTFQENALTPEATQRVATLAQVARAHPDFPVLVVLHGLHGATARDTARNDTLVKALRDAGAPKVEGRVAGDALPVSPPHGPGAARNERVEIVFVAPTS
jgi:hypothetical protein